jgi:hypothetical protein
MSDPSTGQFEPLAEHFNGTSWSVVPSPSVPGSFFNGVAGVSSNDMWAVGTGSSTTTPLVEHWNGTSWSVVTSPSIRNSHLTGVSGTSSTDVWAVGSAGRSTSDHVEILHWNGTAWSVVSAPSPGIEPFLSSVVALAPNNVWGVGETTGVNGSFGTGQTLIEHWDGTSWSVVTSPNAGGGSPSAANELLGVAAISANDIWAVGRFLDPNTNVYRTLTEHWDGTSWSVIPSPSATAGDSDSLTGVTANSNGDVVAVGEAPLSNGQANGLANNEPSGGTPVGPANRPPSPPAPAPASPIDAGSRNEAAQAGVRGPIRRCDSGILRGHHT